MSSWDLVAKFTEWFPKGGPIDRPAPKPEPEEKKVAKPAPRASNAGDHVNLKKLENPKKIYEKEMKALCARVEDQVPHPDRDKVDKVIARELDVERYANSGFTLNIDGHASTPTLQQDAQRCVQFRYQQALEADDRAYKYNHSEQGQAEMKRQTDIDNERMRRHHLKYHPK